MMKLTVAFLAALAVADASGAHGRRHVRRQYGYGGYSESSAAPAGFTNSSSAATPASSTALPVGVSSSVVVASESSVAIPTFVGTGYGSSSGADSTALPAATSSSLPTFPSSGTIPTYVGTGSAVSSAVAETPATTAAPTFPSTGFSFPVTGVVNSTAGAEELVTSIVYSTQVFTVTSCGSTVSDCPAKSTVMVTSVVAVGTTVCPKASLTPTAAGSSALPAQSSLSPSALVEISSTPASEITHKVTKTYTYTVGTGSVAHPTTTEVVETSTETVYKTIYLTKPAGSIALPTATPAETLEGTTTVSSTSTTTKYITVYPTPAASSAEGLGSVVPTGPGGVVPTGPAGGECLPPVTVTVTAQETVYVVSGP
ncbi:hypothetical protein BCR34DRAFT_65207 [Clohesyomyces aquaticus]|uniref:Uncharacterized protein n=1 Tax=Clohesyomyces aquaticus TaxID=1231657 RepID=A0A1Y1Z1Y1_9PLEO|nr:hypothetical protein BCR34DRAFT_65207 [Clohesyomyces aquaticus]